MDWFLLTILVLVTLAQGYPSGPPEIACKTRKPAHGVDAQPGVCPYSVFSEEWAPGAKTEMAIFPDSEFAEFRGFLVSITHNNVTVGKMKLFSTKPKDLEAKVMCGGTSLSHASGEDKSFIHFEWEAPVDLPSDAKLMVKLAVVKEKEIFWTDCQSYALRAVGENVSMNEMTTPMAKKQIAPIKSARLRLNSNYQGERHMKHEVISTTQCLEAGNYYTLVDGSGCRKYTQSTNQNGGGFQFACPGTTVFVPRVCACALSSHVNPCARP